MDPNEALANLRRALDDEDEDDMSPADKLGEAWEAFSALDTWLERGGFLPARWKH